ncbi:penicillin-binding protein activator LpoB [Ottowia sp.]|uniref:penicillin-binding protein activator LpoB n=1 Tax=Ottowia sp. TaxID=1898956 RepID=UPI002BFB2A3C|nr:penicillin-binding protein activator LpoB [Ottowia sp.]
MRLYHSIARRLSMLVTAGAVMLLAACSTIDRGASPSLERQASWVVLPFVNHTETPMAGSRAESIAQALLQAQGVGTVRRAPTGTQKDALFGAQDNARMDDALTWAREQKVRYALAGSVDEWRYKVGVDGEPAAGVTLSILDVATGDTLWSGTGGRSGWSRQALSAVAQQLIRDLLQSGLADAR